LLRFSIVAHSSTALVCAALNIPGIGSVTGPSPNRRASLQMAKGTSGSGSKCVAQCLHCCFSVSFSAVCCLQGLQRAAAAQVFSALPQEPARFATSTMCLLLTSCTSLFAAIVTHPKFQTASLVLVFINTIFMSLDHHGMSSGYAAVSLACNHINTTRTKLTLCWFERFWTSRRRC
jgi:hypothetical protein